MMLDGETWKSVKDFPCYEISNYGRVKSRKQSGPKILRSGIGKSGYCQITLFKQKKRFYFLIHHLVLEAFVGPCPKGHEANHKDTIKINNKSTNLEWVTHSENYAHAYKLGLMSRLGEKAPGAKLKSNEVIEIRRLVKLGTNRRMLAQMFNIHKSTISGIVCRRTWSHI